MRVSVLTPAHNRAKEIVRLYSSLEKSTFKDFEWIIVDDGSTDNTKKVIEGIKDKSSFPIRYFYQENKGKYHALNKLYDLATSEYCFQIDDDDELLPEAMEKGLGIWDSMNPDDRDKTWCVVGRCIDEEKKEMVGKEFPENINSLKKNKLKKVLKTCPDEKCGFQKVSVVKEYKFPSIEGCKFIFESFLWDQINEDYKQFYTNEKFRIYHIPKAGGDNLSNRKSDKSKERALSDYYLHKYILRECPHKYRFLSKKYLRSVIYIKTSAKIGQISNKELLGGLKMRERIVIRLITVPLKVLKKW